MTIPYVTQTVTCGTCGGRGTFQNPDGSDRQKCYNCHGRGHVEVNYAPNHPALKADGAKSVQKKLTDEPRSVPEGYDSDTERDYAANLIIRKQMGEILDWAREPISIRLVRRSNGKWREYEPDFLVLTKTGLELHEVKPNFIKKEARVGELKLDLAAEFCKRFGITLVRVERGANGGWWLREC